MPKPAPLRTDSLRRSQAEQFAQVRDEPVPPLLSSWMSVKAHPYQIEELRPVLENRFVRMSEMLALSRLARLIPRLAPPPAEPSRESPDTLTFSVRTTFWTELL